MSRIRFSIRRNVSRRCVREWLIVGEPKYSRRFFANGIDLSARYRTRVRVERSPGSTIRSIRQCRFRLATAKLAGSPSNFQLPKLDPTSLDRRFPFRFLRVSSSPSSFEPYRPLLLPPTTPAPRVGHASQFLTIIASLGPR